MPPRVKKRKERSVFFQVFFGIIAAVIALWVIGFAAELTLIAVAASAIKSSFESITTSTNSKPIDLRIPKATQNLREAPEPVKSLTQAGQNIILDMGNKQLAYIKQQQALKYKEDNDLPPREHPGRWAKLNGGDRTCWVHVKTTKRVCE